MGKGNRKFSEAKKIPRGFNHGTTPCGSGKAKERSYTMRGLRAIGAPLVLWLVANNGVSFLKRDPVQCRYGPPQ